MEDERLGRLLAQMLVVALAVKMIACPCVCASEPHGAHAARLLDWVSGSHPTRCSHDLADPSDTGSPATAPCVCDGALVARDAPTVEAGGTIAVDMPAFFAVLAFDRVDGPEVSAPGWERVPWPAGRPALGDRAWLQVFRF